MAKRIVRMSTAQDGKTPQRKAVRLHKDAYKGKRGRKK